MPFAAFEKVYSVSSEDSVHCAANLLKNEPAKKWKTAANGETSANIVLQLAQPEIITGVDIGNEHSAFIEVLVGKNGCSADNFKELVLTSSFMTPIESKNSNNINRIRCFNKSDESWIKINSDEKWSLIKFICTQPFNKHVQYGLSLVKVHIAANESKELVPQKFLQQQHKIIEETKSINTEVNSCRFIGKFKLRDDSDDDENKPTTLFNRWKKQSLTSEAENKPNTAAASIRDASRYIQETNSTKKTSFSKHSNAVVDDKDFTVLDRNRDDILYTKNDKDSNDKFERKIALDKEKLEKINKQKLELNTKRTKKDDKPSHLQNQKDSKETPKEKKYQKDNQPGSFSSKMKDLFKNDSSDSEEFSVNKSPKLKPDNIISTNNRKKRVSSEEINSIEAKRKKSCPNYKPFNRLLDDVVLVISGIQNPHRTNLRGKALELGAKYKPDWDATCTHLICAFKNTPKYIQVKNSGGKIIKKSWIENCYNLKKRLPWRRYALNSDDEAKSESEEEILDICLQPTSFEIPQNKTKRSPEASTSKYLDKCEETSNKNSTEIKHKNTNLFESPEKGNNESETLITIDEDVKTDKDITVVETRDIYEVSTDEDDFTKSKQLEKLRNEKFFFKNTKFYLEPNLSDVDRKKLMHMIEEFGGSICEAAHTSNFIITSNRVKYLNLDNFKGEIVKPLWIYECNDMECFIPTKRYVL